MRMAEPQAGFEHNGTRLRLEFSSGKAQARRKDVPCPPRSGVRVQESAGTKEGGSSDTLYTSVRTNFAMDEFATPRRAHVPSLRENAAVGTPGPHLRTPGVGDRQALPPSADPVLRSDEKRVKVARSSLGVRFDGEAGVRTEEKEECDEDARSFFKGGASIEAPPDDSPPVRRARRPVTFRGSGPLNDTRETGLVEVSTYDIAQLSKAVAEPEAEPQEGQSSPSQPIAESLGKRKPTVNLSSLSEAVCPLVKRKQMPIGLLAKLDSARNVRKQTSAVS